MAFQLILNLFESFQSIRRKYPMVLSYFKHLQNLPDDRHNEEVECMKKYIDKNRQLSDKIIDDWYYYGTKPATPIYFKSVVMIGTESVQESFWKTMHDLEVMLFPDGFVDIVKEDDAQPPGEADLITAAVDSMSLFAGEDEIRKLVAVKGKDVSEVLSSPEFKHLLKRIGSDIASGKRSLKDIVDTLDKLLSLVKDNMDGELVDAIRSLSKTLTAANRGEVPDMNNVMKLLQRMKFQ